LIEGGGDGYCFATPGVSDQHNALHICFTEKLMILIFISVFPLFRMFEQKPGSCRHFTAAEITWPNAFTPNNNFATLI
jgi:hypothetical protein